MADAFPPTSKMENILIAAPKQIPTAGLKYAAVHLLEVAQGAGWATQDDLHLCIDPKVTQTLQIKADIHTAIALQINKVQGGLKGPSQNARNEINTWAPRAIQLNYRLNDATVQQAFASFLLAVVTDGFMGENTTGTQIGNFTHGQWRGGGF